MKSKVCLTCKKVFKVWPYRLKEGRGKYCSVSCYHKKPLKRETKKCLVCGKEFSNYPSLFKLRPNLYKYCSRKCFAKARSTKVTKTCLICGSKFETKLKNIKKGQGNYCSKACWYSTNELKKNGRQVGLTRIGLKPWITGKKHTKETIIKMSFAKKGKPSSFLGKKHSLETKKKISKKLIGREPNSGSFKRGELTGEKHPNWQGGITPRNTKIRNSLEYKEWRKSIFERDDYTCQICGTRGCQLHVDHIKQFAYYPDLRFDLNNGRTLCVLCHKQTDTYLNNRRIYA